MDCKVMDYAGVNPKFEAKVIWEARGPIEKLRAKIILWDKDRSAPEPKLRTASPAHSIPGSDGIR